MFTAGCVAYSPVSICTKQLLQTLKHKFIYIYVLVSVCLLCVYLRRGVCVCVYLRPGVCLCVCVYLRRGVCVCVYTYVVVSVCVCVSTSWCVCVCVRARVDLVTVLTADGLVFSHPLHHIGKTVADLPLIVIDSFKHIYTWPHNPTNDLTCVYLCAPICLSVCPSTSIHTCMHTV